MKLEGWREKLLEMAVALFPEYEKHYFAGVDRIFICINHGFPMKEECICLHWYEFVQTFLAERIFNPDPMKPQRGLQEKMKDFFWSNNIYWYNRNVPKGADTYDWEAPHPIDYLYNLFKQQKQ